jgi:hypothetical protein
MHTPTDTIPRSPSSHTAARGPPDPAPASWPTLTNATAPAPRHWHLDGLAALATDDGARRAAREAVDLRYVRRMVAECAALCPVDGEVRA